MFSGKGIRFVWFTFIWLGWVGGRGEERRERENILPKMSTYCEGEKEKKKQERKKKKPILDSYML